MGLVDDEHLVRKIDPKRLSSRLLEDEVVRQSHDLRSHTGQLGNKRSDTRTGATDLRLRDDRPRPVVRTHVRLLPKHNEILDILYRRLLHIARGSQSACRVPSKSRRR